MWNVFTGLIFSHNVWRGLIFIKCFHWVYFFYNVSLGLICIFIIIINFIFCRFRLVSPRSYIITLIPTLNNFHKQTNKQTNNVECGNPKAVDRRWRIQTFCKSVDVYSVRNVAGESISLISMGNLVNQIGKHDFSCV